MLIGVGAIYLLVGALLYLLQDRFIFLPEALPADHTFEFDRPFDELWFERPDGGRINALHFHANKPKGIIMYHHGNAGNLSRWGEVSYFFLDLGYDVLIYDYRGYERVLVAEASNSCFQMLARSMNPCLRNGSPVKLLFMEDPWDRAWQVSWHQKCLMAN